MGDGNAREGTSELRGDVGKGVAPEDFTGPRANESDSRIEMRTGDRSESEDDGNECSAGGECVGEESDGDVARAEPLTHNSGTNHGGEEKQRSDKFCGDAPREAGCHERPMSSMLR